MRPTARWVAASGSPSTASCAGGSSEVRVTSQPWGPKHPTRTVREVLCTHLWQAHALGELEGVACTPDPHVAHCVPGVPKLCAGKTRCHFRTDAATPYAQADAPRRCTRLRCHELHLPDPLPRERRPKDRQEHQDRLFCRQDLRGEPGTVGALEGEPRIARLERVGGAPLDEDGAGRDRHARDTLATGTRRSAHREGAASRHRATDAEPQVQTGDIARRARAPGKRAMESQCARYGHGKPHQGLHRCFDHMFWQAARLAL